VLYFADISCQLKQSERKLEKITRASDTKARYDVNPGRISNFEIPYDVNTISDAIIPRSSRFPALSFLCCSPTKSCILRAFSSENPSDTASLNLSVVSAKLDAKLGVSRPKEMARYSPLSHTSKFSQMHVNTNKLLVWKGVRRAATNAYRLCRARRNFQSSANSKELFLAEVEWNELYSRRASFIAGPTWSRSSRMKDGRDVQSPVETRSLLKLWQWQ